MIIFGYILTAMVCATFGFLISTVLSAAKISDIAERLCDAEVRLDQQLTATRELAGLLTMILAECEPLGLPEQVVSAARQRLALV